MWMYVHHGCAVHKEARGGCSMHGVGVTMCMLGTELRSSIRAASVLVNGAISPAS